MRLLYVATSYPPATGGAQSYLHQLAIRMRERHPLQVVSQWDEYRTDWLLGTTVRAPAASRDYSVDGVPVHRFGLSLTEKLQLAPFVPIFYPLMGVALPPIAALLGAHLAPFATKADLIHNVRIGREGISQAAFDLARRRDLPFVFTPVHHPRWVGWRYRAFLRLYREADAVVALTEAERRTLIKLGVAEQRVAVTGHGPVLSPDAHPDQFRKRHGLGAGPIVLFLGQHYLYKGFRQVLDAAPLVWALFPETQFVFVGPAVRNSERAFAERADPRVHRLGQIDLQAKTDALAACDLLCVPSTQESFGGVYTEAWSLGKPVIGCIIPAVAEVVSDSVDGLLVEQTPHAVADAICSLLREPARAAAMGAEGLRKVEARYAWPRLVERTEALYRTLVGSRSQQSQTV